MTLWKQEGTPGRYRIDDRFGAKRHLEVSSQDSSGRGLLVRLEVGGALHENVDCTCERDCVDTTIAVPALELLAALQGAGVSVPDVAGVWGLDPFAATEPVDGGTVVRLVRDCGREPEDLCGFTLDEECSMHPTSGGTDAPQA